MKKVCFILTAEFAVRAFLVSHLKTLSQHYALTVIVNTDNPDFLRDMGVNVTVIPLNIDRKVHVFSDFKILWQLIELFKQHQFDAVHSLMPKSGLLGMLAARIVGIPIRLHTFTGQVWANMHGVPRWVFKSVDWLIGRLSTYNLADGHSQLQFLFDEWVLSPEKASVLSEGSIAGVDTTRFKPNLEARARVREALNIRDDAFMFVYIGRMNQDKGVMDLAKAFNLLEKQNAYLLFVGPDESDMCKKVRAITKGKVIYTRFVPYTTNPEAYMAASDAICLPSYREGFNNVIIEAAAVGLPCIASNIYGVVDSVDDQQTGLLHHAGDVDMIADCMRRLMVDASFCAQLASSAQQKVADHFENRILTAAWLDFYQAQFAALKS